MVLVEGIGYNFGILQCCHLAVLPNFHKTAIGINKGIGCNQVRHAAYTQLVGLKVVESLSPFEIEGVLAGVSGRELARRSLFCLEGDALIGHVPGKLVDGGLVLNSRQLGLQKRLIGFESRQLFLKVYITLNICGLQRNIVQVLCFNLHGCGIRSGAKGSKREQVRDHRCGFPGEGTVPFQAAGGQDERTIQGVDFFREQLKGFFLRADVHAILIRPPVNFHVNTAYLRHFQPFFP